jgi:hypothetical protein
MANKLVKVFDNIGFNFQTINGKISPIKILSGFNGLNQNHVGYYIPYICRNKKLGLLEIGIGDVQNDDTGNVVINKHKIVVSSNNNNDVNFGNEKDNEFFVFANQNIFNSSISNVVVIDSNTVIDNVSAIYLADCSNQPISVTLPEISNSENIVLEFKNISPNYNLSIRDSKGGSVSILDDQKSYAKLVPTNDSWVSLADNNTEYVGIQSSDQQISAQSSPTGDDFSLQYKEGSDLVGSNIYWDSVNNDLLLGADNSTDAYSVIPTSGNRPLYINQKKLNSDFVVYGSGNRNLFFSYDGRLGLNMPSGSRPSTIFHIVNTVCQEGLRLENRNACHPADITLFHKPNSAINNGSVVSQINLAGKNTSGNKVDYGAIEALAINTTSSLEEGGLQFKIAAASTGIKVFDSNYSATTVGYSGNNLTINRTGSTVVRNNSAAVSLSSNSVNISGSSVALSAPSLVFGNASSSISAPGAISAGAISATSLQSNNIVAPNIGSGSFITTNGNNQLVGSTTMSVNSLGTLNLPIASNKLLQTTTNGAITGIYSTDDYFRTDGDIVWNKYTHRLVSACLKQITFINPVSVEEYSIGDQLAVVLSSSTVYRRIVDVYINNNLITGLLVDQDVSSSDVDGITVYSVTKGGYLDMQISTEGGVISDSTKNVLSARAGTSTTFNTLQKDIDFSVYGIDSVPALKVKANSGKISIISGMYRPFSPKHELPAFPIVVTTGGVGLSNLYSSANFNYSNTQNLFSGIVSDVGSNGLPSHYGTYDQNGNASEWVEKPYMLESRDKEEYAAGGSYSTSNALGGSGLKHIETLTRASGYSYVGFRVASLYNTTDPTTISSTDQLSMSFVGVIDPQNTEDVSTTYIKNGETFNSIIINNLGVVDNMYRIGRYEVTNKQYCRFLNAVAKNNDRGLYDSRMSSQNVGGISRIFDAEYIYTTKPNMDNKPVLFVNYLSVIRFINWLHNGASVTISESNIDYNLDMGAYSIIPIGTDSYNVVQSSYRKYWLPNLNEWHKAAYFEPVDVNAYTGTSTVMVKREDPYLVASGLDSDTNKFKELFANLSVSGWLYVDHLIVGDGTIRSSKRFTGLIPSTGTTTNTQNVTTQTTNNINLPPTSLDDIINSDNNAVETTASTVSVGTSISGIPLRRAQDTDCVENPPWFCNPNNTGPSLF